MHLCFACTHEGTESAQPNKPKRTGSCLWCPMPALKTTKHNKQTFSLRPLLMVSFFGKMLATPRTTAQNDVLSCETRTVGCVYKSRDASQQQHAPVPSSRTFLPCSHRLCIAVYTVLCVSFALASFSSSSTSRHDASVAESFWCFRCVHALRKKKRVVLLFLLIVFFLAQRFLASSFSGLIPRFLPCSDWLAACVCMVRCDCDHPPVKSSPEFCPLPFQEHDLAQQATVLYVRSIP